jgi:hypothetical protein
MRAIPSVQLSNRLFTAPAHTKNQQIAVANSSSVSLVKYPG